MCGLLAYVYRLQDEIVTDYHVQIEAEESPDISMSFEVESVPFFVIIKVRQEGNAFGFTDNARVHVWWQELLAQTPKS